MKKLKAFIYNHENVYAAVILAFDRKDAEKLIAAGGETDFNPKHLSSISMIWAKDHFFTLTKPKRGIVTETFS